MSSKKRKSTGQIWYICDICKAILQVKDTSIHKGNSCAIHEKNLLHPFIKNEILFTQIETLKVEDSSSLKTISNEKHNDFIFISINALQLMKVPIGDPVLLCPMNDLNFTPIVKNAWPFPDKILSAAVTKQVAALYSLDASNCISVHPIKSNVMFAKRITIKCETDFEIINKIDFLKNLKHRYLANIYIVGNKISYNFFGRLLIFKITDIQPMNEDFSVWHMNSQPLMYTVIEETVWKLHGKDTENAEKEKARKKIAGLDNTVKDLEEIVALALHNEKRLPGLHITRGVLIFGPGGTGKTTLVEVIAQKFEVNLVKIETSQLFSKYTGEAERQLVKKFEEAKQLSPSIILIDEIDVICPKVSKTNDQEKRITSTLSILLDKLHADNDNSVFVAGTTSKLNEIHKSLRRPGRFGKEIELLVPNANQRKEILQIYLENTDHDMDERDLKEVGDSSHGFVGADLVSLVSKAVLRTMKRSMGDRVVIDDFRWALTKVKPSAMKEVLIEIPNVLWSDIGGQEELKLKLRQAIEWPLKYEESFRRMGIVPPRGLLMFGPPGCSKTMIAKALATESKLNFISVKGPELFSKWVGESEKAVREVFRRARQVAPSIVFFDELDAIGGERNTSSGGTSVEERVLAQLLTELDGVEPLGNVTIVGATNRLDRIDPALLRPGRFDRIVYVPLPDFETRRQIFSIQFKKTPIGKDVDINELLQKTEGYSGAEIVAVCHEAALKALEEDMKSSLVLRKHFLIALNIILPRTPQTLLKVYDKYVNK